MGMPVASGIFIAWIEGSLGSPCFLVRKARIQHQAGMRGKGRGQIKGAQACWPSPPMPLWGHRELRRPSKEDRPKDVSTSWGLAGPSCCWPLLLYAPYSWIHSVGGSSEGQDY